MHPLTTVTGITERSGGGYEVTTVRTGLHLGKRTRSFSAAHVIMAAGTFNTQKLLHQMSDSGKLPRLSKRLGRLSRTNSESILGAIAKSPDSDYTRGVAITSSWYPDQNTHVEPVRYGKGSNSMGLLQSVITVPQLGRARWKTWARELVRQRRNVASLLNVHHWSERAVISLVMQPVDNSLTIVGKKSRFGRWHLTTKKDESNPAPTYLPVAHEVIKRVAEKIGGVPGSSVFENFDAAVTAHFVGGCVIGADAEHGVIDAYHRAFGHPGLHVVDGAAITANLGVNPSLTITAQAERAMALWPNKGEEDSRPELGLPYVRVQPVAPKNPVVPDHAPAALRLPIVAL